MKFEEVIATADGLFVGPLLWAKKTADEEEAEDAIKNIDKLLDLKKTRIKRTAKERNQNEA